MHGIETRLYGMKLNFVLCYTTSKEIDASENMDQDYVSVTSSITPTLFLHVSPVHQRAIFSR